MAGFLMMGLCYVLPLYIVSSFKQNFLFNVIKSLSQ